MGGDPWEPKRPKDPMGGEPLGTQGIPWEGILGSPKDPMGGEPLGAQGIPWEGPGVGWGGVGFSWVPFWNFVHHRAFVTFSLGS